VQTVEKDDTEGEEMERYDYRHMMKRDKRRWAKADENGDGLLTKAEFTSFLHPEEVDHMKDVVIEVCMEAVLHTHTLLKIHLSIHLLIRTRQQWL